MKRYRMDRARSPLVFLSLLFFAFALALGQTATAKIYKWVDGDGNVHYSQQPPRDASVTRSNVRVPGARDEEDGVKLPASMLRSYCEEVRELAMRVASKMRQGASADRLLTASHTSESSLLVKQIVAFVYGFKHTSGSAAGISDLVYGQCINGTYSRYAKSYLRSGQPDDILGTERDENANQAGFQSGTGWVVANGFVLTNHHVVGTRTDISVTLPNGDELPAHVVRRDVANDLLLLTIEDPSRLPPSLPLSREQTGIGSDVFTIGYPHVDIMGRSPKVTKGIISATTGIQDDERFYQISVPVQAGNSGGPLLNMSGEVVGVITAKLNALAMFRWRGDLPQNVNYAIKSELVLDLLNSAESAFAPQQSSTGDTSSLGQLAAIVKPSVLLVVAR